MSPVSQLMEMYRHIGCNEWVLRSGLWHLWRALATRLPTSANIRKGSNLLIATYSYSNNINIQYYYQILERSTLLKGHQFLIIGQIMILKNWYKWYTNPWDDVKTLQIWIFFMKYDSSFKLFELFPHFLAAHLLPLTPFESRPRNQALWRPLGT